MKNKINKCVGIYFFTASLLFLGTLFFTQIGVAEAAHSDDFVTTWKTDNDGSSNSTSITIPTNGSGYNYSVDWNDDGIFEQTGITDSVTHDFGVAGNYTIRISGIFPRIYFNFEGDNQKILSVDQWGTGAWDNMNSAFMGCVNLTSDATDMPNLANVTDMSSMFDSAYVFNQDIGGWDVSNVTNMHGMFYYASAFNQDLNTWNTANVTNMSRLFAGAAVFNGNIGNWDVSKVTDMSQMFSDAFAFNQNIGGWDVSNVINMQGMLSGTSAFNQSIGGWDTSKVTDMSQMFSGASTFNQNLNSWNTSNVTDMLSMFMNASAFNGNISNWDTSKVTRMFQMFTYASAFNQNIGSWDVSNVTVMNRMFMCATNFNQNINGWDVSKVEDMGNMFYDATAFNQNISSWDVSMVAYMGYMFYGDLAFNQDISSWDVSNVLDMSEMFTGITLSLDNYDAILSRWGMQVLQHDVVFGGGGSQYCAGASARASMIATYTWTITDGGNSCPDIPVVTTDPVSNINTITAVGNLTIISAGIENPTGKIEWGTTSGAYTDHCDVVTSPAGSYACDMNGLISNTTYYVRASAINSAGTAIGNEVTFTTNPIITIPSIITNSITNITDASAIGNLTISDTGNEDPTSKIEWGTSSGAYTHHCDIEANPVGDYYCNLTNLLANTQYFVRASATNSAGTTNGAEVSFTTTDSGDMPGETPLPVEEKVTDNSCTPTRLEAKGVSSSQVNLTWKDNCGVEDGYDIERRVGDDKFEKIDSVDKNKESYKDKNLEADTTYEYRVRATHKHDKSDYSNKDTAKTFENEKREIIATSDIRKIETPSIVEEPKLETIQPAIITTPDTSKESNASNEQKVSEPIKVKEEKISDSKNFIEEPAVQHASTAIEIVGLLTGAATAYAASTAMSVPLFPTSPSPFSGGFSRALSLLGFVGHTKRKDNDWGVVFDAETRRPVSAAVVSVIDQDGRVIDSTSTDSQGRYGFLANDGKYTIRVQKDGYEMENNETVDEFYGDLYTGKDFEVIQHEMVKMNVALVNTRIDWQDFAKRKIEAYTSVFAVIKKDAFVIMFYVGFFAAAAIMYYSPNTLNGIILTFYAVIIIYRLFFKSKSFGLITNGEDLPVPFSMVSLYKEEEPDKRVSFAVSDVIGRYYLLANDGEYLMKVQGQELAGKPFSRLMKVEVRNGILKNDVRI